MRSIKILTLLSLLVFAGCKETSIPIETVGNNAQAVTLQMSLKFGASPLTLGQKFVTAAGDTIAFNLLKLFISEIELVDTTGRGISVGDSVFYIALDNPAMAGGQINLPFKAAPGLYRGIKFSVGVPYALNHRDAATLPEPLRSAVNEMYWSWNPGFIFHRIEGTVDSAGATRDFVYHIGLDNRKLVVPLATLVGSAKTSFEVKTTGSNLFAVDADYSQIFATGLTPPEPMKVKMQLTERETHSFGSEAALADRIFSNKQLMFKRTN